MLSTTRNLVPRLASLMARQQLGRQALLSTTSRMRDSGDPMRKQGDWPRTKEERERAARKYNLIPEDYEPYPEGLGWGDYPNLKCIGDYNKDWYDDYTDIFESKHYGQPIELHSDLYFWERIDPLADEKPAQYQRWQKNIVWFFLCISPFAVYWFFTINPTGRSIHPNHRYKFKEVNLPGTKFYWFPTREKPQHH